MCAATPHEQLLAASSTCASTRVRGIRHATLCHSLMTTCSPLGSVYRTNAWPKLNMDAMVCLYHGPSTTPTPSQNTNSTAGGDDTPSARSMSPMIVATLLMGVPSAAPKSGGMAPVDEALSLLARLPAAVCRGRPAMLAQARAHAVCERTSAVAAKHYVMLCYCNPMFVVSRTALIFGLAADVLGRGHRSP